MNYMPTIGVDFAIKNIVAHGYNVKLQIWDTAGLKKFRTITSSYVKGCRAMILCFDCTNPQSFHNLN
jgi:GTPase SAR1 family protein